MAFLKKNWKWFALGTVITVVLIVGLLALRVLNFIGDIKGERVSEGVTSTDAGLQAQVTATALARKCAASQDCVTSAGSGSTAGPNSTSAPGLPAPTITSISIAPPTLTPDLANSKVVQRIKAGERVTIMYMGYGGPGHEGEFLTDTILVLSYDPKSQTVTEFNIPRDLYVTVPTGPAGKPFKSKANGVFSTIMKWEKSTQDELDPRYRWTNPRQQQEVGANLAANAFQNVLGFKIDYWVTMNFTAFRTLIDKMGGVNVCVDRAFVDNDYPRNDNDQVDAGVMTIKFDKGCQMMNGDRAIQFARSRKSESEEGGDFARSARQMKVIASIKEEITKRNLFTNALGYMDALQGNIRVSLDEGEIFAIAGFFNSGEGKSTFNNVRFDPEIMTGNNFLDSVNKGGVLGYVLIPQAGEDKYNDIQAWVKSAFTHPTLRREQVYLQVLNASGLQGKAQSLTDFLETEGFRLAVPEAAPLSDETTLIDYTEGVGTTNISTLKSFLPNLKVVALPPDKKPYPTAPGLMLYLGKDYKGVSTSQSGGQGGSPPPTAKP